MCPRIGAHVSTAGGLAAIRERAARLEAEAIQFFPSNPRTWRATTYAAQDIERFREDLAAARVPLFLHTIYLVNLASPDETLRARSAGAVAQALAFGALTGASGVVTHVGSHKGDGFTAAFRRVVLALEEAHARAEEALEDTGIPLPPLLLETSAGQANSLGRDARELGRLLAVLDRPAGVCLDTAHLFVAGYPIQTSRGRDAYLEDLDRWVGLTRVGLIHLNDARRPLGSRHDQHENLGEGAIGPEGLAGWVTHPALTAVPFVLEVPGFEGHGPDRRNLERAKGWRDRPAPGTAS
jgi:deoxyribonuclease-4